MWVSWSLDRSRSSLVDIVFLQSDTRLGSKWSTSWLSSNRALFDSYLPSTFFFLHRTTSAVGVTQDITMLSTFGSCLSFQTELGYWSLQSSSSISEVESWRIYKLELESRWNINLKESNQWGKLERVPVSRRSKMEMLWREVFEVDEILSREEKVKGYILVFFSNLGDNGLLL